MKRLPRLAITLFIILVALTPAYAQEQEPPDARDFVLQALANTSELSGYQFTYEARSSSTYVSRNVSSDGFQFTVYQILTLEGKASANGDNYTYMTLTAERNQADAEATPPLRIERTVVEGESALKFQLQDSAYESLTDILMGWHTYEDLLSAAEEQYSRTVIELMNQQPLPTQLLISDPLINSVTELEPEIIDGINLRVFDIAIEGRSYILKRRFERSSQPLIELVKYLFETVTEPSITTYNINQRLWISVENHQLYLALLREEDTNTHMQVNFQGFDTSTTSEIELRMWAQGEPVEIDPVVLVN